MDLLLLILFIVSFIKSIFTSFFSSAEKEQILTAIGEHRSSKEETSSLSQILYEADKKSRMCFLCPAEKECYWDLSKKNMMIQY